ncbi:hypothetical protein ACO0QE_001754 [Hanseniaspora vineae]
MSTFTRGPVCGVDNCPSRLWRNLDGRRTCQYGHVMMGDVEYDDDGENIGVGTRRIRLTTDSRGNFQSSQLQGSQSQHSQRREVEVLYGKDATLHFLRCLQTILAQQTVEVLQIFEGVPVEAFTELVKSFWIRYLSIIQHEETTGLSLISNICFIYMALIVANVPVFCKDLWDNILDLKITYHQSSKCLPDGWFQKLPNYYKLKLSGVGLWKELTFYRKLHKMCYKIEFNEFCKQRAFDNNFPWELCIAKLITQYRLPMQLFVLIQQACAELPNLLEANFLVKEISKDGLSKNSVVYFNEIRCVCLLLIFVKACRSDDVFDDKYLKKWIELLPSWSNQNDKTYMMKKTFYNNALPQNDKQEETYLNWVEQTVLPNFDKLNGESEKLKLDEKIVLRKLYNIVPLANSMEDMRPQSGRSEIVLEQRDSVAKHYEHLYSTSPEVLHHSRSLSDSSEEENDLQEPDSFEITSRDDSQRLFENFEASLLKEVVVDFQVSVEHLQLCMNLLCKDLA